MLFWNGGGCYPSSYLARVTEVILIRVERKKLNYQNLTIFFDKIFYENWLFWTFIFLHFCKYFQFRTPYLSLQYLIFCVRISGIYWIQAHFDKSNTKPTVPQRTSPIFYDTHFRNELMLTLTLESASLQSILLAKKRMGSLRDLISGCWSNMSNSSLATTIRNLSEESTTKTIPWHSL